jgi:hypothetical protein
MGTHHRASLSSSSCSHCQWLSRTTGWCRAVAPCEVALGWKGLDRLEGCQYASRMIVYGIPLTNQVTVDV